MSVTRGAGSRPRQGADAAGSGSGTIVLAIGLFAVLGVLVPLALSLDLTVSGHDFDVRHTEPMILAHWGIAVYSAMRMSQCVFGPQARYYYFFYWVYVYIFLALSPILQMISGVSAGNYYLGQSVQNTIVVVVAAGLVVFDVGYSITGRRTTSRVDRRKSKGPFTWNQPIQLVLAGVGVAALVVYLSKVGLASLVLPRVEYDLLVSDKIDNETFATLLRSLASAPFLALFVIRATIWRRTRLVTDLAIVLVLGAVVAVLYNPVANSRYYSAVAAVALLAPFVSLIESKFARMNFSLAYIVCFVAVFPFADRYRTSLSTDTQSSATLADTIASKMDYDSYTQIGIGIQYISAHGPKYGIQLLSALFSWVPRQVWPEKAIPTGKEIAQYAQFDFTNLSAPLWIEFYFDGGLFAVVIGMAIVGMLCKRLDGIIANSAVGAPAQYAAFIPSLFMPILLRGSLIAIVPAVAILAVALRLSIRRGRGAARTTEPPGLGDLQMSR